MTGILSSVVVGPSRAPGAGQGFHIAVGLSRLAPHILHPVAQIVSHLRTTTAPLCCLNCSPSLFSFLSSLHS
jgi:hypothetical protein